MERNSLIALILIGLVLLLWPVYMKKVVGIKEKARQAPVEQAVQENQNEPSTSSTETEVISPPAEVQQRPLLITEKPDKFITVENSLFSGKLSSLGGGTIISWKLKKHLGPVMSTLGGKREWVELIPDSSVGNLGLILGSGRGLDLRTMNFPDIETRTWVEKSDTLKSVIFSRSFDGSGRVEKEFIIHSKHYEVDVQIRFTGLSPNTTGTAYDIVWSSGINPTENHTKNDLSFCEAFALQGGEQLKTKGNSTGLREGETSWVAIRNKYFLMALVPRKPLGSAAELQGEKIILQFDGKPVDWRSFEARLTMPVKAGETSSDQITLYIGPMDYLSLKGLDAQLEKMMNFGSLIIRPFSIAFFYTLQFLYNIIKNYGWTIIVFAIIIKIVLHPLTRKSYQSMRKMQELQPDINKLREQFKNNPQKLNQATMKLYKDKGINPMGGCLPMLLQMPVLFALFNLFRTTIMLRQASFMGGLIQDLSAPDKMLVGINVLPILMGATMIIQQKMSSTQNPQQKAMAFFMPVFMVFIFYQLSAGLNLYYLMFNILTIGNEMLTKRKKQA